jgi:hypothetical protein
MDGNVFTPHALQQGETRHIGRWAFRVLFRKYVVIAVNTRGSLSLAKVTGESGTRYSIPVFIRSLGIVHIAESKSISRHLAPMASSVRVLVKIMDSSVLALRSLGSR